ncbi:tRNA lysidine(34) synthetase TilS [Mycoplasmopsis verecunda]|uniref:tRNA(Ile)-lysidine synthase n=1 Tax=Mycoplasmopsis verecunda TaxID=171291 RepID=A0A1T4LPA3_9BACT|nr:tRNA lysidine(34) synthetase TilS [Mycoplasmopsis verecunda]WPB54539.1 tRNA lysidine(34) synthetase TilS [Mycoplasmopsis verecunda]SJZ56550.1 tRNA(Ile)-lysidine synthase [Mycoplasmopsis verecunda]
MPKPTYNKCLIAVSGGSDSMFLLDRYKNQNIVVAHVNYHQREDSSIETEIVKKFCNKNKIPLFILELAKEDYEKGNFEQWAREKRYKFFKEIYDKENCDVLLTAHNKDDFFESALMTYESNRQKDFYGIKQHNFVYGMNVYRPYVNKYWKDYIAHRCIYERIPFHIDSSNFRTKYTRNKIRMTFHNQPFKKNMWYLYFVSKNKKLNHVNKKIDAEFVLWEDKNFSQDEFINLKYKNKLVYKYINKNYEHINLTSGKINSIVQFILSNNRTSKYKLADNIYIYKIKGLLKINNNPTH